MTIELELKVPFTICEGKGIYVQHIITIPKLDVRKHIHSGHGNSLSRQFTKRQTLQVA